MRTRTTTTPATAWCCTWTPATRCTSSWTEAKRTEATTISTALSLAFFCTPISTRPATQHERPRHRRAWGRLAFLYPVLPPFLLVSAVSTGHFSFVISLYGFFLPLWKRNRSETKRSPCLLSAICSDPPSPFVSLCVLCVMRGTRQLETPELFLGCVGEPRVPTVLHMEFELVTFFFVNEY